MRTLLLRFALCALAAGVSGCGGGSSGLHCLAGDPFCGSVTRDYVLNTISSTATPIPVGTTVSVLVEERLCVGTGSQSGPPPGVKLGCDAPFPANALTTAVLPIGLNGPPCPVTATFVGHGGVNVTRNGPGDPTLFAGTSHLSGYCTVTVTDPTRRAGGGHPSASFEV